MPCGFPGRFRRCLRIPSAELFDTSSAYLIRKGYRVARLDFRPEHRSLQYNPLARVSKSPEAQRIADVLIRAAYPHPVRDPFWRDSAASLLGLLVELLITDPSSPTTLSTLCQWLYSMAATPAYLDKKVLTHLPPTTQQRYKAFWAQDPKLTASILSTCQTALHKVAADPHIQWLTNTDTLHLSTLRTQPTALFIIVAEKDLPYFRFLLSLFFIQLFDSCLGAPKRGSPFLPVHIFLDEFGQLDIPHFPTYINLLRKYQVSVSVIVQELSQIHARYGDHAKSIIYGAISNHLYFPGLSPTTTAQLQQVLGSTSLNGGTAPLLPRDAIRTLPRNRALFVTGNTRPVLLRTRPWYRSWVLRRRGRVS